MLTESSIKAAYPLAEKLAAQGISLRAINDTPLAQLVSASLALATTTAGVNPDLLEAVPSFAGSLVDSSKLTDPVGGNPHDEAMASTIKAVGDAVTGNLAIARSVVNPIIKQVADATQGHLEQASGSALCPLNVVPYNYKPIWDSPILRELAGIHQNVPVMEMELKPLGLVAPDGLVGSLMTGAARFDEELTAWLNAGVEARLESVWSRLFGKNSEQYLTAVLRPGYLNNDDVLVAYLFARRVVSNPPEGVDMDLSAWTAYASAIMAQAGRAVMRVMEKRDLDVRLGNLVFDAPTTYEAKGDVMVVGDVYSRWLAEGGTPEVLFGSVMSDRKFGYRDLLDRKDEYARTWNSEYRMLQQTAAANRYNDLIVGLRNAVTGAINSAPEDALVCDRAVLHEKLKSHIERVKPQHLEDVYGISRKLVCRVMFEHTDAEQILNAIDAAAAANPELNLREAALLAVVDVVAVWLSKRVVVEEIADRALGY